MFSGCRVLARVRERFSKNKICINEREKGSEREREAEGEEGVGTFSQVMQKLEKFSSVEAKKFKT